MRKNQPNKQEPQIVTIKVSRVLLDQYDQVIDRKGITRSEAIRAYMVDYVEKHVERDAEKH